jgi:hypothetical protein
MWFYNDQVVDALPDDCVGFVYLITNLTNNRKYVGKKLSKFSKTTYRVVKLKNGTKKRKKIRSKIDSDWQTYYGSSVELLADVTQLGADKFKREILHYCNAKAVCSYLEAKEQFDRKVLESTDYYNGIISLKVHKNHIRDKL